MCQVNMILVVPSIQKDPSIDQLLFMIPFLFQAGGVFYGAPLNERQVYCAISVFGSVPNIDMPASRKKRLRLPLIKRLRE